MPPTLSPTGLGAKKADAIEQQKKADDTARPSFPDHWNKPDVRGALYGSFGRVCAYCGGDLAHNDRGDVEHYRPKGKVDEDPAHGGYWWLAYDYGNYFLSCRVCNSTRKSDRFPLLGGARVRFATRHRLPQERRALLDPEVDAIENMLLLDLDDVTCPVKPDPTLAGDELERVRQTIEFFDLNGNVLLIKERRRASTAVLEAIADSRWELATALACRAVPHSLVARQIVALADASRLPDDARELSVQLAVLGEEIEIAATLLERAGGGGADVANAEKTLDELLWALGALLATSTGSDEPIVRALAERLGVLDEVVARAEGLKLE